MVSVVKLSANIQMLISQKRERYLQLPSEYFQIEKAFLKTKHI